MATSSSSSPTADTDNLKHNLDNQIRSHKVAIAELTNISASRPVYKKNGNLFFRTTPQKAMAFAQKEIDAAQKILQKLNSV